MRSKIRAANGFSSSQLGRDSVSGAGILVGDSIILADPIFKGLAIALMAGEIASLLISRMAVPVLYFMANGGNTEVPAVSPADPETR